MDPPAELAVKEIVMLNIGEQLVSSYLRYIRQCEFIQTNLHTVETQGEIDVVGINLKKKQVYICEVAIHLITGLQYIKNGQINNIQKFTDKFSRNIEYANKHFDEYEKHFMLWSPVVKNSQGKSVNNQLGHLKEIEANIRTKYKIDLECVVNENFQSCLQEMRRFAVSQTAEFQCPVMRMLQIEEYLTKHLAKLSVGMTT